MKGLAIGHERFRRSPITSRVDFCLAGRMRNALARLPVSITGGNGPTRKIKRASHTLHKGAGSLTRTCFMRSWVRPTMQDQATSPVFLEHCPWHPMFWIWPQGLSRDTTRQA